MHVDTSAGGTTELRIHGVSGTPPESMLEHPHAERVAGDSRSGFYRRWFPGAQSLDVAGVSRREAYSWGGLTSGGASRALWLLLLPFALVNLASWTEPGPPQDRPKQRQVAEALLRLFGISLTGTMVVATASVSMDLLAWQCAAPGSRCAGQDPVAGLVARLGTPGARLAGAVIVPALLVGLLWYLGNRTWRQYEAVPMPPLDDSAAPYASPGEAGPEGSPSTVGPAVSLEAPHFWKGQVPVRRLRALHVAGAWSLLAVLVVTPTVRHLPAGDAGRLVAGTVAWAALLLVAACGGGVLVPAIADRRDSHDDLPPTEQRLEPIWRWLPWVGVGLLVVAVAVSAGPLRTRWVPQEPGGSLPLINGFLLGGFAAQVLLLLLLVALMAGLPRHRAEDAVVPAAVHGQALPLLASTGWLLAGGFAAGAALRVAQWLGDPVSDPADYRARLLATVPLETDPVARQVAALARPQPLYVPQLYTWVALVAAVLVLVAVPVLAGAIGGRLWRLDRRRSRELGRDPDAARYRTIGRIRDVAELTDVAPRYLGLLVLATCSLVAAAVVGWLLVPAWPQRHLAALTDFGSWAMGAGALLLVALGRAAYRTPHLRRTVGILWDVASFWPRAVHPLAPPCYSERVVPELTNRSRYLTAGAEDRLLLSAHSQGSVIALATVLQLPQDTASRTCLLTYGSPLTRLYGAFFPGYVNRTTYRSMSRRLGCAADDPGRWPWRNLYRVTDPIGRWVLAPTSGADGAHQLDLEFVDPVVDRPPGDLAWPPALGHSNYWHDPRFEEVTRQVLALRGTAHDGPAGIAG